MNIKQLILISVSVVCIGTPLFASVTVSIGQPTVISGGGQGNNSDSGSGFDAQFTNNDVGENFFVPMDEKSEEQPEGNSVAANELAKQQSLADYFKSVRDKHLDKFDQKSDQETTKDTTQTKEQ